jgi:hypothetical protein
MRASDQELENKALDAINEIEKLLNSLSINQELRLQYNYELTFLYSELIRDAGSFFRYSGLKNDALSNATAINKDFFPLRILQIRELLLNPEQAGGNPILGLQDLNELYARYPNSFEILLTFGDYYFSINDFITSKDYYERARNLKQDSYAIDAKLKDVELLLGNYTISKIIVVNPLENLESYTFILSNYENSLYGAETRQLIQQDFMEFPNVVGVSISAKKELGETISLEITPEEDNLEVFGIQAEGSLSPDYNNDLEFGGIPALVYINENAFGTGNEFTGIFAGIFASVDYTLSDRPGKPFDLNFHLDGLVLGFDETVYIDGEAEAWSISSPNASIALGLGKSFSPGISFFLENTITYKDYSSDSSNFIRPENNLTYYAGLDFEFSMQQSSFPSLFIPPVGFRLGIHPELIYQLNYTDWGKVGDLYTHDENPAFRAKYELSYYHAIEALINFGGTVAFLHGFNGYQNELWTLGHGSTVQPSFRLNGYYDDEFRTELALLINLDLTLQIVKDVFAFRLSHDLAYLDELGSFLNGTTANFAFMLPERFELGLAGSMAWNAQRMDKGLAWRIDLTLSYFSIN